MSIGNRRTAQNDPGPNEVPRQQVKRGGNRVTPAKKERQAYRWAPAALAGNGTHRTSPPIFGGDAPDARALPRHPRVGI